MRFVIEMEPEGSYQEEQGKDVQGKETISNEEPIQFTIDNFDEEDFQSPSFKLELEDNIPPEGQVTEYQPNDMFLSETSQVESELVTELQNSDTAFEPTMDIDVKHTATFNDYFHDAELSEENNKTLKVRLDKWLWAARFYKTRPLARDAVEKGYVFYNGVPTTPNREVQEGATLCIRQGRMNKTITVKRLSTRRRSAQEACELYEETFQDTAHREKNYMRATSPYRRHEYRQPHTRSVRYLRRSYHKKGGPMAQQGHATSSYEGDYDY